MNEECGLRSRKKREKGGDGLMYLMNGEVSYGKEDKEDTCSQTEDATEGSKDSKHLYMR